MFNVGGMRDAVEVDEFMRELVATNAEERIEHTGGRAVHNSVVHNFFKSFDSANVFEQYRSRYMSEYSVILEINNTTRSDKRYLFDILSSSPEKRICFAQEREVSEEVLLVVGPRKYVRAADYTVSIQEGSIEKSSLNAEIPTIVYSIRFHNSWKLASESSNNVLLVCEEYWADDPRAFVRSFVNTGLAFYVPYYKVNVPRTYENLVSTMFSYEVVGGRKEYNRVLIRYLQYYHKVLQDYVHRIGYSVYVDRNFIDNPAGARFAADLLINYVNFERSMKAHSNSVRYRDLFLFCDAACRVARKDVTNIPDDQSSGKQLDVLCAIYVLTCDERKYFVDRVDDLCRRFLEAMIAFNSHYRAVSVVQTYMSVLSVSSSDRQGIIIPEVVPNLFESTRTVIEVFAASREGFSGIEEIAHMYERGSEIERETIAAISIATIGSELSIRDRLMHIPVYRSMLSTYQKRRDFVQSECVFTEDNSAAMFDIVRNGGMLGLTIAHVVVREIEQLHRMGYLSNPIGTIPSVIERENLIGLCDDLMLNASGIERYSIHRCMLRNLVREEINGVHCTPKVEEFVKVCGKSAKEQRRKSSSKRQEAVSTVHELSSGITAAENAINSALENINAESAASSSRQCTR